MYYGSCIGCSKDCKQQPVLTPEDNCKNFSHSNITTKFNPCNSCIWKSNTKCPACKDGELWEEA